MDVKIPKATARRLPLYYRCLVGLQSEGVERVSSTELSQALQIDSASIRRDFSYFGALGKRGYGYDVPKLLSFFKQLLNQDQLENVALVGVGNMGRALLNYNFKRTNNIRISCAFDVDETITNRIVSGIPIYEIGDLEKQIQDQEISIAILAVPAAVAQKTAEKLYEAGIRGIMNFTPTRLQLPAEVKLQNVDLATELQTLIYFLNN
ncbi:MAG: redox-sensing transcriptional repressor Rex [Lactobacillus sp.]|nr:redox-sensing transcriptional repressor Rex [Lactobacillus sp.]